MVIWLEWDGRFEFCHCVLALTYRQIIDDGAGLDSTVHEISASEFKLAE